MPREEIEHQLDVLSTLEQHGFATNYLLPRLAAAPDAGLCDRYLVTAEGGGGPWAVLVTFCAGTAGDKMLSAADAVLRAWPSPWQTPAHTRTHLHTPSHASHPSPPPHSRSSVRCLSRWARALADSTQSRGRRHAWQRCGTSAAATRCVPMPHDRADATPTATPCHGACRPTSLSLPPLRHSCAAPAPPLRHSCAAPAPPLCRPYAAPMPPLCRCATRASCCGRERWRPH